MAHFEHKIKEVPVVQLFAVPEAEVCLLHCLLHQRRERLLHGNDAIFSQALRLLVEHKVRVPPPLFLLDDSLLGLIVPNFDLVRSTKEIQRHLGVRHLVLGDVRVVEAVPFAAASVANERVIVPTLQLTRVHRHTNKRVVFGWHRPWCLSVHHSVLCVHTIYCPRPKVDTFRELKPCVCLHPNVLIQVPHESLGVHRENLGKLFETVAA
mmetsp:Transcript_3540/g.8760  ORF Transcript_3540/g.8760 Transcript_3540/m.8760 type:complete len:209 (+) Transcript_3540:1294-1920(+)